MTLTGTGGVGKTRLALAAAASLCAFLQGVFFVALAAVRDAEVMWKAIAGELDVDGEGRPRSWSICVTVRLCWYWTTWSSCTAPPRSRPRC